MHMCEYRQIFLREDVKWKILFCRKFQCERDDARTKCERWTDFVDPSALNWEGKPGLSGLPRLFFIRE